MHQRDSRLGKKVNPRNWAACPHAGSGDHAVTMSPPKLGASWGGPKPWQGGCSQLSSTDDCISVQQEEPSATKTVVNTEETGGCTRWMQPQNTTEPPAGTKRRISSETADPGSRGWCSLWNTHNVCTRWASWCCSHLCGGAVVLQIYADAAQSWVFSWCICRHPGHHLPSQAEAECPFESPGHTTALKQAFCQHICCINKCLT